MKSALALLTLVCLTMHACALASVAVTTPSAGFLCSEDGTLLTEADAYSAVTPLGDSGLFSCVRPDGGIIICDSDGKTLSDDEYTGASYAYGRLVVSRGGLSALFDLEMNALTGWDFTHILPVSSSRFFAFRTNIYDDIADAIYLLLPDGRALPAGVSVAYPSQLEFNERNTPALSSVTGLYGYLDENGNWRLLSEYVCAGAFNNSAAPAGTSDGMGVIDRLGYWLLEPVYESVIVGESCILARDGDYLYAFAREDNALMLTGEYPDAYGAEAGDYYAVYDKDAARLFTREGACAAEFAPDTLVLPASEARVIIADGEGMRLYDIETGVKSAPYFYVEQLLLAGIYRYAVYSEEGSLCFGLMDKDGSLLTDAVYEYISAPAEGFISAEAIGYVYLYALEGNELTELLRLDTQIE